MHKNFLSKNVIGLSALSIGVVLLIGFVVANDGTDNKAQVKTVEEKVMTMDDSEIKDESKTEDEPDIIDSKQDNEDSLDERQENEEKNDEIKDESANKQGITNNEVAGHNTKDDCWMIIDQKVYDVTSYVADHPGGDVIVSECGGDGSSAFNTGVNNAGESVKSKDSHSASAQIQLEDFLIGDLAI